MNTKLHSHLSAAISAATQQQFELQHSTPVGGGCINETSCIADSNGTRYFLKLNDERHHTMSVAETAGLEAIAASHTIRVPRPIVHGIAEGRSYLVLEHLELGPRGDAALLGAQLAALHRCTAPHFGFAQGNFIGATPQPNKWTDDWITFWGEQRLGFQLRLARREWLRRGVAKTRC